MLASHSLTFSNGLYLCVSTDFNCNESKLDYFLEPIWAQKLLMPLLRFREMQSVVTVEKQNSVSLVCSVCFGLVPPSRFTLAEPAESVATARDDVPTHP